MGEEWRNTGARKKSEMLYQKLFTATAKKGVKRMIVVVKRRDLHVLMRVFVTRCKNAKTKKIIIVIMVVTMRRSN